MNGFIRLACSESELMRNVDALLRRDLLAHDKAASKLLDIICQQVLPVQVPAGFKLEFKWSVDCRSRRDCIARCLLIAKDLSRKKASLYESAYRCYSFSGLCDELKVNVYSKLMFLRYLLDGKRIVVEFNDDKTLARSSIASCTACVISFFLKKHDTIEGFLESLLSAGYDVSGVL